MSASLHTSGWFWESQRPAPENTIVWVPGGLAEKRDGTWYTGMDVPRFQRPIQWYVWCWKLLDVPEHPGMGPSHDD